MPSRPFPDRAENLLCAALRGEVAAWPWLGEEPLPQEFTQAVELHGVAGMLHGQPAVGAWSAAAQQYLREQAMRRAMWELTHQHMLAQVLGALAAADIEPILFKGTALAYSLYPEAPQRFRSDTDLIIPFHAADGLRAILDSQGFERAIAVEGETISYQASYFRRGADGTSHALDVHWRINNSELLSQLFNYEELRREAVRLPALAPEALAASPVYALMLACMHRLTHEHNPYHVQGEAHHTADRLVWLMDIHLLAGALSAGEWGQLLRLASDKGLGAVCANGLRRAQACFHTRYPDGILASLERNGSNERPAVYLRAGAWRQQWMDFQALGSIARRARFMRELFFPSARYMRAKFPSQPPWMLPWLYLRRSIAGAARRLHRMMGG